MIEMMRRKGGGADEVDTFLSEAGFWVAFSMMLVQLTLFYKYYTHTTAMRRGFPTRSSDARCAGRVSRFSRRDWGGKLGVFKRSNESIGGAKWLDYIPRCSPPSATGSNQITRVIETHLNLVPTRHARLHARRSDHPIPRQRYPAPLPYLDIQVHTQPACSRPPPTILPPTSDPTPTRVAGAARYRGGFAWGSHSPLSRRTSYSTECSTL